MDRNALNKIGYGLYVVTSGVKDRFNGQIANTLFQVASKPEAVAVSINKVNFTHELVKSSGVFAASILSKATPLKFIGAFGFRSGRNVDKFDGVKFKVGETGTRVVLDYSVAYLEARVVRDVDVGSHTLFIGEIVDAQVLSEEEPMTYSYYREVKRGTTPKAAPTHRAEASAP
ncbi:MAG: flavin reductase family protein [Candidatus Nezhaarchaeota archaeon]|nr:flavin reductase family protein [Candidatus Nezhaarchaeota archaeon]